jgi:hypothetical protein
MMAQIVAGLFRRAVDALMFYGALIQYRNGNLWIAAGFLSIAIAPWPPVKVRT